MRKEGKHLEENRLPYFSVLSFLSCPVIWGWALESLHPPPHLWFAHRQDF